jgi:hypothetical protein
MAKAMSGWMCNLKDNPIDNETRSVTIRLSRLVENLLALPVDHGQN